MCFLSCILLLSIYPLYYFYYHLFITSYFMLSFWSIRSTQFICWHGGPIKGRYCTCLEILKYWKNCCPSSFLFILPPPSSTLSLIASSITTSHSRSNYRSYSLFSLISFLKPSVRWFISSSCLLVWACYFFPWLPYHSFHQRGWKRRERLTSFPPCTPVSVN